MEKLKGLKQQIKDWNSVNRAKASSKKKEILDQIDRIDRLEEHNDIQGQQIEERKKLKAELLE